MASNKKTDKLDDNPSKLLLETVKFIATVAGSLAGLAAFFSFFGFVITLSYSVSKGIYGIPQFAEQFFQEVGLIFLNGFFTTLKGLPWLFLFLFSTCIMVFFSIADHLFPVHFSGKPGEKQITNESDHTLKGKGYQKKRGKKRPLTFRRFQPVFNVIMSAVALIIIFKLDTFGSIAARSRVFYIFVIPVYFGLILYLSFHYSDFTIKRNRRSSLFSVLFGLFLLESLFMPISYGANIFDLPLSRVLRISCKASSGSLRALEDISAPAVMEEGITYQKPMMESTASLPVTRVFYLLGHTSGREIFFVKNYSQSKVEMVTFDASAIESIELYTNESVEEKETLNSILKNIPEIQPEEKTVSLEQIDLNKLLSPQGVKEFIKQEADERDETK